MDIRKEFNPGKLIANLFVFWSFINIVLSIIFSVFAVVDHISIRKRKKRGDLLIRGSLF
ncbi:hypothetical protein ACFQ4Z_12170 [Oceanobacillus oncorhynchi subsp. oncorhynchi]|uniref:hypothetical protein n=1 Tax=Oceanobacillus oncorhynchi TaxID=545501 RepID=UPI00362A4E58